MTIFFAIRRTKRIGMGDKTYRDGAHVWLQFTSSKANWNWVKKETTNESFRVGIRGIGIIRGSGVKGGAKPRPREGSAGPGPLSVEDSSKFFNFGNFPLFFRLWHPILLYPYVPSLLSYTWYRLWSRIGTLTLALEERSHKNCLKNELT